MIAALDVDCIALRDELPQNTKDPDLFQFLKKKKKTSKKLVFLSDDKSQLTREVEARLLKELRVTSIYFEPFWSKLRRWDQAIWLVKHWQTIEKFCESTEYGSCGRMKQRGKIEQFKL